MEKVQRMCPILIKDRCVGECHILGEPGRCCLNCAIPLSGKCDITRNACGYVVKVDKYRRGEQ